VLTSRLSQNEIEARSGIWKGIGYEIDLELKDVIRKKLDSTITGGPEKTTC